MTVTLRKASRGDAQQLVAWRNEDRDAFLDTGVVTLAGHLAWWHEVYERDPWDHYYVVEHDDRPAGTIGLKITSRGPEIHRVLLGDKNIARKGVMSEALAKLTAGYGYPRYRLIVRRGNDTALEFYQRNGFRVTGREDACWVMERGG